MMSLIGFIVALGILVTVHEWGHYRVALACGVQVLRFSIGFGRPLVRWQRVQAGLGTPIEFVIGSIPLGGYVKLLDTREGEVSERMQTFAFDHQPLKARTAIVLAGPMANFVLAVLLYALIFVAGTWQVPATLSTPVPESAAQRAGIRAGEVVHAVGLDADEMRTVDSLEDLRWWLQLQSPQQPFFFGLGDAQGQTIRTVKVEPSLHEDAPEQMGLRLDALGLSAPQTPALLRELVPNGAAERAGLQRGDLVLRVNDQLVTDAHQLRQLVRDSASAGEPSEHVWRVQRAGHEEEVLVTLDVVQESGRTIGRLGAMLGQTPQKIWVDYDVFDGLAKAVQRTLDVTQLTLQTFWDMLSGEASWRNLGGPIAIAEVAGQSMQIGWDAFVAYLAVLSVSLGVFNLLPIPALDGGHLMYYLYEFLAGKPPANRWVLLFQQAGFWVLMALMVVALLNDLNRLSG